MNGDPDPKHWLLVKVPVPVIKMSEKKSYQKTIPVV
jgi:hypothetical protein